MTFPIFSIIIKLKIDFFDLCSCISIIAFYCPRYSRIAPLTLLENCPPCLSHENENMGGCFMFQAGASTRSEA